MVSKDKFYEDTKAAAIEIIKAVSASFENSKIIDLRLVISDHLTIVFEVELAGTYSTICTGNVDIRLCPHFKSHIRRKTMKINPKTADIAKIVNKIKDVKVVIDAAMTKQKNLDDKLAPMRNKVAAIKASSEYTTGGRLWIDCGGYRSEAVVHVVCNTPEELEEMYNLIKVKLSTFRSAETK